MDAIRWGIDSRAVKKLQIPVFFYFSLFLSLDKIKCRITLGNNISIYYVYIVYDGAQKVKSPSFICESLTIKSLL